MSQFELQISLKMHTPKTMTLRIADRIEGTYSVFINGRNKITVMNTMKSPMHRYLIYLFHLYMICLCLSMAGMELTSTLIVLFSIGKWRRLGPDLGFVLFWTVIAIGAFFIPVLPAGMTLEVIGEARWILILYALVGWLFHIKDEQTRIFNTLIFASMLVALYAIFQSFTGLDPIGGRKVLFAGTPEFSIWRTQALFSNSMSYAYSVGIMAIFSGAALLIRFKTSMHSLFIYLSPLLTGLALFLTFSRGAWMAFVIGFYIMVLIWNWRRGLIIVSLFSLILVTTYQTVPAIRQRASSFFKDPTKMKSTAQRLDLYKVNWAMFKDHPWLGVGYGQNAILTPEYNQKILGREGFVSNAHNNYLQVLAGCGIFGFLAWFYFCIYFFLMACRLWWHTRGQKSWAEALALGSIGAQIFFHVGGMSQVTFFDNEPLQLFLFFWALMISQYLHHFGHSSLLRPAQPLPSSQRVEA